MPSEFVDTELTEEASHTHTESDTAAVVEKRKTLRRTRRFRLKRPVTAVSRQYHQDDLIEALDKKLSVLKSTREKDFPPKYLWGSESDASPETLRSPDVRTGWRASVKRRVVSDSRSTNR